MNMYLCASIFMCNFSASSVFFLPFLYPFLKKKLPSCLYYVVPVSHICDPASHKLIVQPQQKAMY